MGRRRILAVVAAVAIASAGLGWVLGQRIKSPAEVAADTAAPDPSLITVPVELRELASRVVVRGTVESSGSTDISVSGSTEGASLITGLLKEAGDPLDEGDVVLEVAGRPIIVLQGELPEYRNLGPGMNGPDVRQLEIALNRLGYDPGDVDDVYTPATGAAVAQLYRDVGYRPNEPSRADENAVEAAKDRVDEIQSQINSAGGGSGGSSGIDQSRLLQLNLAITHAEEAVADAKATRSSQLAELQAACTEAKNARDAAQKVLDEAKKRLAQAENGTNPDTGQPPTEEELAALREAVTNAQTALDEAQAAYDAAAQTLADAAEPLDRAVRDAEVALQVAKARKSEAIEAANQGGGGEGSGVDVGDLRDDLSDAQADLAELRSITGVTLPVSEFRFVKTLPSVVQTVNVELGETPSGSAMTISGASTVLESSVSESDWKLLEVGLEGLAEDDDLGLSVPVRITKLATDASNAEGSSGRYPMTFAPLGEVAEEAMFQSLRITIPISSTGGEVLAVPLAAVSAGADGSARVEVEHGDGTTVLVPVNTGLSAEGYVEVRPTSGGKLEKGDRVVVGRDLLLPTEDGADNAGSTSGDGGGDAADDSGDAADDSGEG